MKKKKHNWKVISDTKARVKEELLIGKDIELVNRGIRKSLLDNNIDKKITQLARSNRYSYRIVVTAGYTTSKGVKQERAYAERRIGQPSNFNKKVWRIGRKRKTGNKVSKGFQAAYAAVWRQNQNTVNPVIFYKTLRKLSKKRNKFGAPLFRGERARTYTINIKLVRERKKK